MPSGRPCVKFKYLRIELALIIFAGMLLAGIGETHVNNLLTSMNIPPIHHETSKKRERKARKALENVADRALRSATLLDMSRKGVKKAVFQQPRKLRTNLIIHSFIPSVTPTFFLHESFTLLILH